MESMAMECAIVASDTQPLHEVIKHDFTGRLVPFFDGLGMVQQVVDLLGSPSDRQRLGQAARRLAVDHYDLKRVCLPRQLQWVSDLAQLTARSL
jgi:glycosyltransferase involved in cell wall biosynthesis